MSVSHKHSSFNYIELYTLLQQTPSSQQSQIIDQSEPTFVYLEEVKNVYSYEAKDVELDEVGAEVNVVDEEEESEIQVDYLLNTNIEDDDHQVSLHDIIILPHTRKCGLQEQRLLNEYMKTKRFCTKNLKKIWWLLRHML